MIHYVGVSDPIISGEVIHTTTLFTFAKEPRYANDVYYY
jgi:hypothetical protein